jgi:hypothetical protein
VCARARSISLDLCTSPQIAIRGRIHELEYLERDLITRSSILVMIENTLTLGQL